MKAATVPWSVKGIDPQHREAAKEAARRSGMTLGEWLKSAINEQAETVDSPRAAKPGGNYPVASFERATSKLEDIAAQLAKLAQRDLPATGYSAYQPEARAQDNEQVSRILNRLEANERQSVEAFTAINERMGTMGRQFAQAAKAATTFKPEEHASFQALEKAVRNIVEHLESSEKRTRDNFKTMQDRLADISKRAATAPNEQVLQQLPAFSHLEQKLSDLSRRVEVTEKAPQPSVPDLLRHELTDLAGRIDVVRETAESLATRAQTQAVLTSQQELRAIEARMQSVLKEAQTAFSKGSATDGELERIRADVEALNKRIDSTRQGTASDRDVHALRVAVEQLSSRVAQGPDLRPLQDMDKRIVELAQRINETPHQSFPQFDEIDSRITELDQRLTHVLSDTQSHEANAALAQQIAAVAARMDKAEQQLSHIDTIERAINQLYDGLEQTRAMGQQVAEDAAMKASQHFAQQFAAQMPTSGPSADIQALEQGLQAVKDAAETSDHRNQETLMALHETLEHIVGKLSELETATIGQRIAVAAGVIAPPAPLTEPDYVTAREHVQPAQTFAQADRGPSIFEDDKQANAETVAHHAAPETAFASDTIPNEGYRALSPDMEQAPAPVTAETGPTEPRLPEIEAKADTQPKPAVDDYIALARAAQAASQNRSAFSGAKQRKVKTEAKSGKSGSIIGALAAKLKRSSATETRTAAEEIRARGKPAAIIEAPAQDASRRKLRYWGLLMLALAGVIAAYQFNGKVKSAIPAKVTELIMPWTTDEPVAQVASLVPAPAAVAAPAAEVPETNVKAQPPVGDDILTGSLSTAAPSLNGIVPAKAIDLENLPPATIGTEKLRMAAATGNAQAQFIVASRFLDGEHVDRDFAQAAQWYARAASAGLAPAQYRMATLFERGKGVDKDIKQALAWYEKAAELGNVRSMHNTAVIYAGTDAGKPDYAKAYKWFSLAANHGLKDSEFNLAILMERGLGAKPDPAGAMFWYLAAGQQNDDDAMKRADAIAQSLPPAQVAAIRLKIKNWKADQAPDAANTVQVNEADWQDQAG
jgi:localization factor PodJL